LFAQSFIKCFEGKKGQIKGERNADNYENEGDSFNFPVNDFFFLQSLDQRLFSFRFEKAYEPTIMIKAKVSKKERIKEALKLLKYKENKESLKKLNEILSVQK